MSRGTLYSLTVFGADDTAPLGVPLIVEGPSYCVHFRIENRLSPAMVAWVRDVFLPSISGAVRADVCIFRPMKFSRYKRVRKFTSTIEVGSVSR